MHTRTPTTPPSTSLHHGATRTVWIAVVALLLLSGSTSAMAQDRGTLPYVPTQTIAHANLTVVPLHHRNPGKMPQGQFLTFDEATKAKVVRVTELDGNTSDAEVNAVHVSNLGDKPIFIMSGEVILGGKQDRIIAQNTIVAPNAQQVTVQVFCVEQGRWDGQTAKFASGGEMGHRELRKKAMFENDQDEVWREVAKQNDAMGVKPATGTYRATLNEAQGKRDVKPYLAAILPKLHADRQAVGVAIAINGTFRSVEAFANPMLFAKVCDKLIRSYALEAASSQKTKGKKKATIRQAQVFMDKVQKAQSVPKAPARRSKSGVMDNTMKKSAKGQSVISLDEAGESIQFMYTE